MTDMERLCRAADVAATEAWTKEQAPHSPLHKFEPIVRAVLKELREPTKEMIVRGQGAGYDTPMEDIYKAMIDTVLQETDNQTTDLGERE